MTEAERTRYLRWLRFQKELEQAFQFEDARKLLPALRIGLVLALGLQLRAETGFFIETRVWDPVCAVLVPGMCWAVIIASFHRGFGKVWQPASMLVFWVVTSVLLVRLGHFFGSSFFIGRYGPNSGELANLASIRIFSLEEVTYLIAGLMLPRIRFRWCVITAVGALIPWTLIAMQTLHVSIQYVLWSNVSNICVPIAMLAFVSYVQERSARGEFAANYLLAQERDQEQRQRERTEAMLHVLGQAIGGVVHDLGNPLTSVQTGAQTLELFLEQDTLDEASLREIIPMITDGGQMLDYLRLSLLEQTRVLEGKPIPIERRHSGIRRLAEEGVRYQKPKFAAGRKVTLVGPDLEAEVDAMRLVTVLMNLVGNALKYSDGEVRVIWSLDSGTLLIGVLDVGRAGTGISHAQSAQLFVPFGRLAAHEEEEGTGLGLLSAQSIVEAHGGELYIEGYEDGTPMSAAFSTTRRGERRMLEAPFRTAFVATCVVAQGAT